MVLRADILARAFDAAADDARPAATADEPARRAADAGARQGARGGPGPIIVCGRFEGVDQRVIEARALEEVSVGDYVLSGGEIAALVLIDACVRLLPGVMGNVTSSDSESFSDGLLEYPQYTRPAEFEGRTIPEVLTSGDHAKVAAWRRAEAEKLTKERAARICGLRLASATGNNHCCSTAKPSRRADVAQADQQSLGW